MEEENLERLIKLRDSKQSVLKQLKEHEGNNRVEIEKLEIFIKEINNDINIIEKNNIEIKRRQGKLNVDTAFVEKKNNLREDKLNNSQNTTRGQRHIDESKKAATKLRQKVKSKTGTINVSLITILKLQNENKQIFKKYNFRDDIELVKQKNFNDTKYNSETKNTKRRIRGVKTQQQTIEEVIEFYKRNGRMPKSSIRRNGKKLTRSEMTDEQYSEVSLYNRWMKLDIRKYAQWKIEDIPDTYREYITRIRDIGIIIKPKEQLQRNSSKTNREEKKISSQHKNAQEIGIEEKLNKNEEENNGGRGESMSIEELLEQIENLKKEEIEIKKKIKSAKLEVKKTEEEYAKEYYAEDVDYEKLVETDKKDKEASAKVEKLENSLSKTRKNIELANLKISKLNLEKQKEDYIKEEPRDKSSYIWKKWYSDKDKIESEIEKKSDKIKSLENELDEKNKIESQEATTEENHQEYKNEQKILTKEEVERTIERLKKQIEQLKDTYNQMMNDNPSDEQMKMLKDKIAKKEKELQDYKDMLKEYEQETKSGGKDENTDSIKQRRLPGRVSAKANTLDRLPQGEILKRLPAEVEREKNKLPIRSFYEIYNATNTQHISTFARAMYNLSHAKLWDRNTDTVQKVLNLALFAPKLISKFVSKPVNFILRTDKKMKDITREVESLSKEEFDVLTNENSDYRREYEKATYLSPTAMKEMKVNNAYLDAVYSRLHRENSERMHQLNEASMLSHKHCDNIILDYLTDEDKQIYLELSSLDYSGKINSEQRAKLQDMRNNTLQKFDMDAQNRWGFFYNMAKANREQAEKIANADARFKTGTELKSSGYKNIAGWFLGKFNPDNREINAEVAKLAEARREEYDKSGYTYDVDIYSKQIEDVLNGATKVTQVGRNQYNKIDRGSASRNYGVEMLDKGKQTKTRQVLAIAGMGLAIAKFFHLRKLQERMNELQSQNKQYDYQYSKTRVEHVHGVDADKIKAAENQLKAKDNLGIEDMSERSSLNDNGWNIGSSGYKNADVITHQRASATMSANNLSNSERTFDSVAQEAIKSNNQYQSAYDINDQFGSAGYIENLKNAQGHSITDVFEAAKKGQDITVSISGTGTINVPYSTFENITMNDITGFPDYVAMGIAGGAAIYGSNLGNVMRTSKVNKDNKRDKREVVKKRNARDGDEQIVI